MKRFSPKRTKAVLLYLDGSATTIKGAMHKAGYSPYSYRNVAIRNSIKEGIAERFQTEITNEKLIKIHKDLLGARKVIIRKYKNGSIVKTEIDDPATVAKALDMAYRITGAYIVQQNIRENEFDSLSDEEIDKRISQLEKTIKRYGNKD